MPMPRLLTFIFTFILSASFFSVSAQTSYELCGSSVLEQELANTDPTHTLRSAEIDRLFKQSILTERANSSRSQDTILYTIPVVFHILHENANANIPDSRVYTEMDHLNEAFRNVGLFDPSIGVDVYLQFCLAQVAPDGTATNGINRHESSYTEITSGDDMSMKAEFNWNPSQYLNIYVVRGINFNGQGIAGYAYYPTSAGQFWDGVVVRQSVVGLSEEESGTTIHEIGHYLGLPHPFNGGCANDDCFLQGDRVCDTPPDNNNITFEGCGGSSNNCSTDADDPSPQNPFTTDVPDFNKLYMDYNIGTCRLAFSAGQSERMRTALRVLRADLLTSSVCRIPQTYDAGITEIRQPVTTECETVFSPEVVLHNFGLVPVSSIEIYYQVDNDPLYIYNWTGSLYYTDSVVVTLPPPGLVSPGAHELVVYTVSPNGQADLSPQNDTSKTSFTYQPVMSLPMVVDFESGIPNTWAIYNPSGTSWQWSDYGCDPNGLLNHSLFFDNSFFYAGGIEDDGFVSPLIDLENATDANLSFDLAYGFDPNTEGTRERLLVEVSTDCGQTFLPSPLFQGSRSDLATQTISLIDPGVWTPQSCSDWRTETMPLDSFLGQQIVLRFTLRKNGNGFPIYLDNINVDGTVLTDIEAELSAHTQIAVFPNPAQGLLHISIKSDEVQPVHIRLLDITGKETPVGSEHASSRELDTTLAVGMLPAGVYLLEIRTGTTLQMEKVLIQ